jgi:hypothetical protein
MQTKKTAKKTAAKRADGAAKHVIVRGDRSGVYFGTLMSESADGRRVVLARARNIHYWQGRLSTLDIASKGVGDGSKISAVVEELSLTDVIAVIKCNPSAVENLEKHPVWQR